MGLHVLAEGAGVRVALGAARDLTGIWLLQHEKGRDGASEGPPARPRSCLGPAVGRMTARGADCRLVPCPSLHVPGQEGSDSASRPTGAGKVPGLVSKEGACVFISPSHWDLRKIASHL